jgi:hypothetical protein
MKKIILILLTSVLGWGMVVWGADKPSKHNNKPVKQTVKPSFKPSSKTPPPTKVTGTNAAPRFDYDSFRVISDLNIFNPSRYPRSSGRPANVEEKKVVVDSFTLVGIVCNEKGQFAFFDAANTQYRKTAKPGSHVAGYTVKGIDEMRVVLELEGSELEMVVGKQMNRQEDGTWVVADRPEGSATFASTSSYSSSSNSRSYGSSSYNRNGNSSSHNHSSGTTPGMPGGFPPGGTPGGTSFGLPGGMPGAMGSPPGALPGGVPGNMPGGNFGPAGGGSSSGGAPEAELLRRLMERRAQEQGR